MGKNNKKEAKNKIKGILKVSKTKQKIIEKPVIESPEIDSDSDSIESQEEQKVVQISKKSKKDLKKTKKAEIQKIIAEDSSSDEDDDDDDDVVQEIKTIPAPPNQDDDSDDEEDDDDEEEGDDDDSDEDEIEDVVQKPKKIPNSKKTDTGIHNHVATPTPNNGANDDPQQPCNRVFISNLPRSITPEIITKFFESNSLTPTDTYLPRGPNGHKGFAFIEFADIDEATKAVNLTGNQIDNNEVTINFAKPRRGGTPSPSFSKGGESCETNILFVKNLDINCSADDLKQHFGNAQDIRVMTNPDGSCKGHAYVEFHSNEVAKEAKENAINAIINGNKCLINFAQPRGNTGYNNNRNSFGGRGRSSRGGFGGDRRGSFGGGRGRGDRNFRGRGDFQNRGNFSGGGRGFGNKQRGNRIQFNDDD